MCNFNPLAELQVPIVADTYSLLHFYSVCLRFLLASDILARGILLECEMLPFEIRKAMYCKLKGYHLKL